MPGSHCRLPTLLKQPDGVGPRLVVRGEMSPVPLLQMLALRRREAIHAMVGMRPHAQGKPSADDEAAREKRMDHPLVHSAWRADTAASTSDIRRRPEISVIVENDVASGSDCPGERCYGRRPQGGVSVWEEAERGDEIHGLVRNDGREIPDVRADERGIRNSRACYLEHGLRDVNANDSSTGNRARQGLRDPAGSAGEVQYRFGSQRHSQFPKHRLFELPHEGAHRETVEVLVVVRAPTLVAGRVVSNVHVRRSAEERLHGQTFLRRISRAGLPTTVAPSATSLVTTDPAPTAAPRPIRHPWKDGHPGTQKGVVADGDSLVPGRHIAKSSTVWRYRVIAGDEVALRAHGDVRPNVNLAAQDAVLTHTSVRSNGRRPVQARPAVDVCGRVHGLAEASGARHPKLLGWPPPRGQLRGQGGVEKPPEQLSRRSPRGRAQLPAPINAWVQMPATESAVGTTAGSGTSFAYNSRSLVAASAASPYGNSCT